MESEKKVTTNAEGCVFGKFFGAGFGGTAYSRKKYYDKDDNPVDWSSKQSYYTTDRGKYFDGTKASGNPLGPSGKYGNKGVGVATDFDYEYFVWSSGPTGGRFYVKFASFSLAQCNDVESTLKKCTIETNFYGGGNLGKVVGTATSILEDCTVKGSVYGAGYSASLPTVEVRDAGFTTNPKYNSQSGMFEPGVFSGTTTFTWQNAEKAGKTLQNGQPGSDLTNHILYTNTVLTGLGEVAKTNLTIKGTTTVGESVYGGGEESGVGGDTEVNVSGGTIGKIGFGGAVYSNVFGGGKGKAGDKDAGYVKGNTAVNISQAENQTTTIYHNIYGGGAYGSVGDFTYDATSGLPTALAKENTGACTVSITGGTIGSNGKENGMVFGSSRGDVANLGTDGVDPNDRMAWVYSTHVIIGDTNAGTSPSVKGSVYGSGENGHTFQNTVVDINKGIVGITSGSAIVDDNGTPDDPSDDKSYSGASYPNRGNVYGGGCGTDMYDSDGDEKKDSYNPLAGIVKGTATVNITGGHVVHNVYGAGAMGSVGGGTDATSGKTIINISGGRVGYDGVDNGHVFGAARGEFGISTAASDLANVRETEVNINYASTPAADNEGKTEQLIAGSVFGGGEAGTVKGNVAVKMTGGLVLKDVYGGGALANTQTSNWDAAANSGAGGWATGKTSASTTTTVRLTGGTIFGEAYGGGLGETGTVIAENARGCAVNEVFGCNNAAGTPMGKVLVHVYATQNKNKTQIANTEGDTPVTDAKVLGTYDVHAVYGGGNLAAYEPAGGKTTTNSTNVIIDGCGLTSIQQVYGGGNAASTPATNVTVNGTFEIEELFGGGNGKDDITINGVTTTNPGANVGFHAYEDNVEGRTDTPANRANYYGYGSGAASVNIYGGKIHSVFGGSNTKGNVRITAVTLLEEKSDTEGTACCKFDVDEAYGGGKSAPMDAEAKLLMQCIPGLKEAYGGAEAADIQGNVALTITNGTFNRVFGGNNLSGTIRGSITVNIEETGCKPIIIGELYGGGNEAGYSVRGYKQVTEGEGVNAVTKWVPRTADDALEPGMTAAFADPQVNVKSFASIGQVFGGGYGENAVMVGNPTVNINEVVGQQANTAAAEIADGEKVRDEYPVPSHAKGKIGAVNNVFGGGNAAKVIGNTNVNIGTLAEVYVVKEVTVGDDVSSLYVRNNDRTYSSASGIALADVTYYEKKTVVGADIRGNVYGGGNNAEVTGNTNVNIGRKVE